MADTQTVSTFSQVTPVHSGDGPPSGHDSESIEDSFSDSRSAVTADNDCQLNLLTNFRNQHKKNLIFGHLNVNSYRYKFHDVSPILQSGIIDLLFLSETKLDESFPPSQFYVDGYTNYRNDRNQNGGGLLAYVRSDLPHRRRYDLEKKVLMGIESLILEVSVRKEKWLYFQVYKPPSVNNNVLIDSLYNVLSITQGDMRSSFILGDININLLKCPESFKDFMELFGLANVIQGATCFKSKENPTLLDIILTDSPNRICDTLNTNIEISDFHNIVCATTKMHVPKCSMPTFYYRSFKNFDEAQYMKDLEYIPFHVAEVFTDLNDSYWFLNKMFVDVLNDHAPLKIGRKNPNHAPFMNSELRKARNVKAMLRRRYDKFPTSANWEKYRVQRNKVTKLRVQSINKYFETNCSSTKHNNFWNAIKPFMSHKPQSGNNYLYLYEEGHIVHDKSQICDIFNEHFTNVATNIGTPDDLLDEESTNTIVDSYSSHDSITSIENEMANREDYKDFSFSPVSEDMVLKKIASLNKRKSTGSDTIPPRLLKISAPCLAKPITKIINMSIEKCTFPDQLKDAEVAPIFKKGDNLDKVNFRPVSILSCVSKIFEYIYHAQIEEYFNKIMSNLLSAFRKEYSCESVLVNMVEDWKKLLDKHEIIGTMMIDLSKAFDCLPHRLLLAKLKAYGFDNDACDLVRSYLENRRQRVKIGNTKGGWLNMSKGVPQGSILGPLLFNIFINDMFYTVGKLCDIYNYADDNNLSNHAKSLSEVKDRLETSSQSAITWFKGNNMGAHPEKFQSMVLGCKNVQDLHGFSFTVGDFNVEPSENAKILGVKVDNDLNFNVHISEICAKAARQLNALARLSKVLQKDVKMTLFNCFILSNFNYCSLVWHHCGTLNTLKMEKIQERGLRLVFNDYDSSYKVLLKSAGKDLLYVSRLKRLALFVFKALNNIGPSYLCDSYEQKQSHYDLRCKSRVVQPKVKSTTYGLNSLRYQGASLWNQLPNDLKECTDVKSFKALLHKWEGPSCTCSYCILCKF